MANRFVSFKRFGNRNIRKLKQSWRNQVSVPSNAVIEHVLKSNFMWFFFGKNIWIFDESTVLYSILNRFLITRAKKQLKQVAEEFPHFKQISNFFSIKNNYVENSAPNWHQTYSYAVSRRPSFNYLHLLKTTPINLKFGEILRHSDTVLQVAINSYTCQTDERILETFYHRIGTNFLAIST